MATSTGPEMQYRSEIDGLRAIAVVPVVFFHAGIGGFEGGFLGVDIFFVISGYLISSIVLRELAQDRFSIATFYERRCRRILPALAFVILCCLPFAEWLMLPGERADFYQSVAATGLFVSNIHFWSQMDYFAAAAELSPMLHTWSLAVEEQFYIFFPPLLWLLWRFGWRITLGAVVGMLLISLGLSEWLSRAHPGANFFLLPSRVWELMAGAVCALLQQRFGAWRNEALAAGGLLLVLGSLALFTEDVAFPSAIGVLPIGGVALLILFARGDTATARLLSLKPFVWIGLISYSLYLWHQPMLAFLRLYSLEEPSVALRLVAGLAAFPLAWFSYRYVETPFRHRDHRYFTRPRMFSMSATAIAALAMGGAALSAPRPGDDRMAALEARVAGVFGLDAACGEARVEDPRCRTEPHPEILVWGDSFAAQTVKAIQGDRGDASLVQATYFRCPPLIDVSPARFNTPPEVTASDCLALNQSVTELLESEPNLRVAVLSSLWGVLRDPTFELVGHDGQARLADAEQLRRSLLRTADVLRSHGVEPVIVAGPPRTEADLGRCILRVAARREPLSNCDFDIADQDPLRVRTEAFLRSVEAHIPVIWPDDIICDDRTCRSVIDGTIIYRDSVHLSDEGAALVGRRLKLFSRIEDLKRGKRRRRHVTAGASRWLASKSAARPLSYAMARGVGSAK